MLSAEIITKTNTYVPTVAVSSIDFTADMNGHGRRGGGLYLLG